MKQITSKNELRYLPFLIPATVIFSIFIVYPVISAFYYGLTDWNGLTEKINFIGLKNFRMIIIDEQFLWAIKNTLKIVIMTLVLQNGIALVLALLLDMNVRTRNILRTVFFVPVVICPLVVSYVWSYIYNYENGLLNTILNVVGLNFLTADWLGDYSLAIYSVTLASIWQCFSYHMVIFLASMQNIPSDLLESAKIDGATGWKAIKNIIIPLIAPAFTINIILCTIGGLKTFDTVFVMTKGGPGYATETITTKMYYEAFTSSKMGYGTAIGVILFLMILIITIIQVKLLREREVEL